MRNIALILLFSLNAVAVTNRTVTVKSSGGDYTSLSAAIAGEAGDLVSLDRQLTIECYAMADTTAIRIDNTAWTTDATRYILITVPSTERHAGFYSTSKYRLEVANDNALELDYGEYVTLEGLQVYSTGNYATLSLGTGTAAASNITIRQCIIRGSSSITYKGPLYITGSGSALANTYVYNNLIYGTYTLSGIGRCIQFDTVGNYYIYNNTLASCGTGMYRNNGTVVAKNNLVSVTTQLGYGTFAAGTDYNRTNVSTLGYSVTGGGNTHDAASRTFTFVNSGSSDYHLQESDVGAKDQGVSDPGSGLFSSDIDGETRFGTWDVGADEYPSASRRRNAIVAWARKSQ